MNVRLNIDPATLPTAQQKGINRSTGHVFTKKRVKDAREVLRWSLVAAVGARRFGPQDGAWSVAIRYCYRPKTFPRRLWGMPKTTRPDCDNLTKLILDVMAETGLFYADDGQVFSLTQGKFYVASPSIEPCVEIDVERHENA